MLKTLILSFAIFGNETSGQLAQSWLKAIKSGSYSEIKKYVHPQCHPSKVKEEILKRMVSGGLPKLYNVNVRKLKGDKKMLQKAYQVLPSHQLDLKYKKSKKFGLGKSFPIAEYKGRWFFVICPK